VEEVSIGVVFIPNLTKISVYNINVCGWIRGRTVALDIRKSSREMLRTLKQRPWYRLIKTYKFLISSVRTACPSNKHKT